MIKSYVVTCNLIEIQHCKEKVMEVVRAGKCFGLGGYGDTVTFHFLTKGGAMTSFLELETFLNNVTVSASPVDINECDLKGVFKYD